MPKGSYVETEKQSHNLAHIEEIMSLEKELSKMKQVRLILIF